MLYAQLLVLCGGSRFFLGLASNLSNFLRQPGYRLTSCFRREALLPGFVQTYNEPSRKPLVMRLCGQDCLERPWN